MTDAHVRPLPDRAATLEMHRRASVSGLAPDILAQDRETVTFVKLPWKLNEWWLQHTDDEARQEMKLHLRDRIVELHVAGICHRDLHCENVMVTAAGTVQFIDFGLARWVDPSWPCYDLTGASDHVPVPFAHAVQAGHETGVWWGPGISDRCLINVVGCQPN
jgi:serine/threonine protein kinase